MSIRNEKASRSVGRKLRIAVLYNEPVTDSLKGWQYVSESGQLKNRALNKTRTASSVDLSELGVMEEMEDIKGALEELGYRVSTLNVDGNIFRLIDYLRHEKPDLIFNLVECVENESQQEMNVAGMYELLKIPYTGASALALGTALQKARVKEILTYHGIKTPRFHLVRPEEKDFMNGHLRFPMIVKPSHEDASVGISDKSVVYNLADLRKRIKYIFHEFEQPALVEEYIDGRELNVAILGNTPPVAMPISEIDFSGLHDDMHKIVSYEAKWVHGTVEFEGTKGVCPAPLTALQEAKIKDIALRSAALVGTRDYARVDIRLSRENVPYVLEVNPNPDISDDAGFARSARAYGLTFHQTIGKIVEIALERVRAEECH